MARRPTIAFVGAGRAAGVIGVALAEAGYPVVAVASRSKASAETVAARTVEAGARDCIAVSPQRAADAAELVLVTANDGAIADVAQQVRWRSGQAVVHCSGALSTDVLDAAKVAGAETGSWHPFQTLAGSATLEGVTFGIGAGDGLYDTLAEMSRAVGGTPLNVPAEARALYHASSVLACGYLTTLLREARRVWEAAGLPREAGREAIASVAQATLSNVHAMGEEATLTGPTSRGDTGTVRLHLESLAEREPELLPLYRAISRRSALLAHEAGRPTNPMEEWDALFEKER